MDFSKATLKEIDKLYKGRHYVDLSIGLLLETKNAVAVTVNYGLVNAEQIGFAILKNDL